MLLEKVQLPIKQKCITKLSSSLVYREKKWDGSRELNTREWRKPLYAARTEVHIHCASHFNLRTELSFQPSAVEARNSPTRGFIEI